METLKMIIYTDEFGTPDVNGDCETEIVIVAKFDVCPRCSGSGTHVNPAVDGNGISREDFDQDPDFEREYIAGTYDVPCYQCNGKRVVLVPDEDANDAALLKQYYDQRDAIAREDAQDAATMRAESGYSY